MSTKNLRAAYVPSWSGDFRIEPDPSDPQKSVLTVEKPTAADKKRLAPFLKLAEERGWTSKYYADEKAVRAGTVHLSVPLSVSGPALLAAASEDETTWTAVRCVNGTVTVVDGTDIPEDCDAEAVATVNKPARGCPEPEAASRRASTVLRTFCTAPQWAQFEREGRLRAIGNVTGRVYYVYHEDEAARRRLKRSLTVVRMAQDGRRVEHPICAWDAGVPAEEQALALKLAVEHREAWLLELGTAAHAGGSDAEGVGDGVNMVPVARQRYS